MKAAVILTKCSQQHGLFGVRAEERSNNEWYATWAFKVTERTAQREKFDATEMSGSFYVTKDYPTCPYCGAKGFFQCAECGKLSCWNGESETVCEWCGNSADTAADEKFDKLAGGGY